MSHFTTLKTRLVSKEYVLKALADLNLRCEVGALEIVDAYGKRTSVEIRVLARGENGEFGFRRAGDAYELVGDWWGIHDLDQKELVQRLTQRYAYNVAKDQFEAQDFVLVEEEVRQDKTIHLVVRRMG
jgi:hypothetical protein